MNRAIVGELSISRGAAYESWLCDGMSGGCRTGICWGRCNYCHRQSQDMTVQETIAAFRIEMKCLNGELSKMPPEFP